MLVPATTSTGIWCCSNHASTPISDIASAPPPPIATPMTGRFFGRSGGGTAGSSGPSLSRVVLAACSPAVAGLVDDFASVPVFWPLVGASFAPNPPVSGVLPLLCGACWAAAWPGVCAGVAAVCACARKVERNRTAQNAAARLRMDELCMKRVPGVELIYSPLDARHGGATVCNSSITAVSLWVSFNAATFMGVFRKENAVAQLFRSLSNRETALQCVLLKQIGELLLE